MKSVPNIVNFDPYLDAERVYTRIRDEFLKYGRLIIAFDFDDTIFNTHNNEGWHYDKIIKLLQRWRPYAYMICWSASTEARYPKMRDYMEWFEIPCDAINANAPWIEERGRKIYANIYLDDRAGMNTSYWALERLISEIEEGKYVSTRDLC